MSTTVTPVPAQLPKSDPFKGIKGRPGEQINATNRLKIAILGKPKSGKSWLAATAPKPILYYDFDDRAESLEGKSGLHVQTKPTMLDVESDLSVLKASKLKGQPLPATIVFDSVTFMVRAMEDEIRRQSPGLFKGIKVGNSTTVYKGKDWDVVVGIQRYMEYLVAELTSLNVNIIFVFHERDEKDTSESSPSETKYTGLVTTNPQYLATTLSLFNEVFRIVINPGRKYRVIVKPNSEVYASTTMLLDPEEDPDIMAMLAKHQAARAKQR